MDLVVADGDGQLDELSRSLAGQEYFKRQLNIRVPALVALLDELEVTVDQLTSHVSEHAPTAHTQADGASENNPTDDQPESEAKPTVQQLILDFAREFFVPTGPKHVERTPELRESFKAMLTFNEELQPQVREMDRLLDDSKRKLDSRTERWVSIGPHTPEQSTHFTSELADITELAKQWRAWLEHWADRQTQAVRQFTENFGAESSAQVSAVNQLSADLKRMMEEDLPTGQLLAQDVASRRSALTDFIDGSLIPKRRLFKRSWSRGAS